MFMNLLWLDNYLLCSPFRMGGSQAGIIGGGGREIRDLRKFSCTPTHLKTPVEKADETIRQPYPALDPAIINAFLCYCNYTHLAVVIVKSLKHREAFCVSYI